MDHNILIIKGLTWENGPLRVRKVLLLKEHPFVQSRFEGMTRALGQNEFIAEDAEEPEGENESGRGHAKARSHKPLRGKGRAFTYRYNTARVSFCQGEKCYPTATRATPAHTSVTPAQRAGLICSPRTYLAARVPKTYGLSAEAGITRLMGSQERSSSKE
jgi:hypothetical protein